MEFKIEEGYVVNVTKEVKDGKNGKFELATVRVRENEFNPDTLSSYMQNYFMKISKELPYSEVEKCKEKKCKLMGRISNYYDRENNKSYTNYIIESITPLN